MSEQCLLYPRKRILGLFGPKVLDRLDRDQKWSSKCGAPQDRADLNRRPDATASRCNAARHRLLTAAPVSLERLQLVLQRFVRVCVESSLRTVLLKNPHRPADFLLGKK